MRNSAAPVLRAMTREDISAAYALERVLYPADPWSLGQFIEEIAGVPESRYYVVLELSGAVIGYAGLLCPARGMDGDIQTLTVAAEHQGKGYGSVLLDALIAEAQRRGAPKAFLEVRHDNAAAIALYRKKGFQLLGTRRNYYGPGIDATTMQLDLGDRDE